MTNNCPRITFLSLLNICIYTPVKMPMWGLHGESMWVPYMEVSDWPHQGQWVKYGLNLIWIVHFT